MSIWQNILFIFSRSNVNVVVVEKSKKVIPYRFFLPTFEEDNSANVHFRLGTIPRETGDWR